MNKNSSRSNNKLRIILMTGFAVLFILGGIILSLTGFLANKNSNSDKDKDCTEPVKATVIENLPQTYKTKNNKGGNRKKTTYTPVYKYEYNGHEYVAQGDFGTSPPQFEIGDEIDIRIDPNEPNKTVIEQSSLTLKIVLIAMGGLFIIVGVFCTIAALKEIKSKKE